jgi:hypothetical protein
MAVNGHHGTQKPAVFCEIRASVCGVESRKRRLDADGRAIRRPLNSWPISNKVNASILLIERVHDNRCAGLFEAEVKPLARLVRVEKPGRGEHLWLSLAYPIRYAGRREDSPVPSRD